MSGGGRKVGSDGGIRYGDEVAVGDGTSRPWKSEPAGERRVPCPQDERPRRGDDQAVSPRSREEEVVGRTPPSEWEVAGLSLEEGMESVWIPNMD